MKQPISAALYMRLSRDDENTGESNSIETQRKIITQYAKDKNIPVYSEYVDDGYSGMNYDRPAFTRMMDDVDNGKVNCIITKDLSRFGREYIQTGFYLEILFPSRGVRYIAVNDNEDSENGLSDFVPFKSLFNDFYAKDTSRKVRAAHKAQFQSGERFCSYAPLGYKKDPEDKNHLVIDDETRWIVERIYSLALQGSGAAKISRILVEEQISTPAYLNYKRYGTFARFFEGKSDSKQYEWDITTVKKILKDETYIGNTVHCRQTKLSYKSKKRVNRPPEDWVTVANTHEAIISQDDFALVQQMIAARRRPRSDGTTQIFAGLVKCADCGCSLVYGMNNQRKTAFFQCSRYAQGFGQCSMHYIRYDVLYAYVLSRLQHWANAVQQNEGAILDGLQKAVVSEQGAGDKRTATEINAARKRLAKLDNLLAKLYEDRLNGTVSERNFSMLTEKYQREQDELTAKIETLTAQLETVKQQTDGIEKWIDAVKRYTNPTELTAEMLNELIEKIVVHSAVKLPNKTREQEIEIYYRFVGRIDKIVSLAK